MSLSGRVRRGAAGARAAWISFLVVELAAIPLLLSWGDKWWFWADDWDFLATRTGGNPGDLFRAHYQHWVTLPVLAYRLMWTVFGIRHYVPYQLMIIALHLVAVALLRLIMQRAGVNAWLATLIAVVFVFFGSGAENILIAFQITFVGAFVFGLVQLLCSDHDGPFDRRDSLGLLAGLAALMCSGVGVAMVGIVGLAVLVRRGWRIALAHTVPLAAAYLVWLGAGPKGQSAGSLGSQSPWQVIQFVFIGAGSALGRLAQVPGLGFALALVLVAGIVLVVRRADLAVLRSRYSVPFALLVGALVFLLVTGVVRSGAPGAVVAKFGVGPSRARQSRYVYVVAAMALPALAVAADAIIRRGRLLAIPVVLLLVAGVPGNLHQLRIYTNQSSINRAKFRAEVLAAPRLPLAPKLPAQLQPSSTASFYGLTLGWLVESVPSGRIPAPKHLDQTQIATDTIHLALRPTKVPAVAGCSPLAGTEPVVLHVFQRLTLRAGSAEVTYLTPAGVASQPVLWPAGVTYIAETGPLDLEVTPVAKPATLCGALFKAS